MKITVIIPTYKPRCYIWECLDSLINQTFSVNDFEIILVLNGCCEPWKSDIEKYISTKMCDMNVKFIHTDIPGVSNARNIALEQATGNYLTFIDDDDYVSPQYLEELYDKANSDTTSLCYPYAFYDSDPDRNQIRYHITDVFNELNLYGRQFYAKSRKYFSSPCMKLIPMRCINSRRFNTNFRNGEDALFMFLISDSFSYVSYTSNKAIYYRRYRESSALTTYRTRFDKITNSCRLILEYSKIYFSSPIKYRFIFYLTRVLASLRSIFV